VTASGRITGYLLAAVFLGAALGSAAAAVMRPPPRVCCRVRLPDKGDTIRMGMICADVVDRDSISTVRVTR